MVLAVLRTLTSPSVNSAFITFKLSSKNQAPSALKSNQAFRELACQQVR